MPNAVYDDPNLGSQMPTPDQATPEAQATNAMTTGTIDQLIKSRPAVQAWFSAHQGGKNLSDSDKQQLFALLKQQGVDSTNLEVDDSGTISWPKHTVRDVALGSLLAFGPLVAAWAAPYAASAAGGGSATTTAASGLGPSTAANLATTSSIAAGSSVPSSLAAASYGPAAAAGGFSVTDALKYGLPTVGNIIGNVIQANAAGKASDAQQKYLEEALAYEKEKDAYDRTTAANKVQLEANRYATYSGNTAPFIANGVTSGNRMTSLLGLPAGAPNAGGSLNGGGGGGSQGVVVSPEITAKVNDYYKSIGVTPTGPGTGPTDAAYYAGKDAETGGLTDANNAYWFGPNSRIGSDLAKAGVKTGTPAPTMSTQPQARTAEQPVTLKGPDGSIKQVPASQLSYWIGKGAQQVSA